MVVATCVPEDIHRLRQKGSGLQPEEMEVLGTRERL